MSAHDCKALVIHVFWHAAGDPEATEKQGCVCAVCGKRISGEVPDNLSQQDPFEPYASVAWTDGDGMDDVRRVAEVWEQSSDERETRP